MPLSLGDRLGRFEILGSLGAGGMGEVYRARDPLLQRDVAIKVLPAGFSDDVARRRRFEREARTAGGLNHPNILAVYDIGAEGATAYIVSEVLEGETLADRMAGQSLPVRKAAEYALQVASGLAAAHDKGVVHRDIKPANLFVTSDGRVKILDFGLAKFVAPDMSGVTETVSVDGGPRPPVMGSVTYMSPEQARGQSLDHRTDIFSFGVVLYELLSGFAPFRRATPGDTLSAIVHDEPAPLPAGDAGMLPLERIVRHCLEKKPDERFQNVRDLIFNLEQSVDKTGPGPDARRRDRAHTVARVSIGIAAVLAAAGAGAFIASRFTSSPAPQSVYRVRPMTSLVGLEEFPSLSPDGRMLAFTAAGSGRRQVFVRFLSGGSSSPLAVTSDDVDHQLPRWTPDGTSLVYFSPAAEGQMQGALFRMRLGGSAQRVTSSVGGGDVSRSGRLTCFRLETERIQLVTSTLEGSDVRVIATFDTKHYAYPRWSPDERWIAYQAGDGFRSDVFVVAATGGTAPIQLTKDRTLIRGLTWLPDSSGIIHASARGSAFPYLPTLALWQVGLDPDQPPRQLTPAEVSYEQPELHASGLLTVTRMRMAFDIWRYPIAGLPAENTRQGQRVTGQTGRVATPSAAPSGDEVVYLSDNGGHSNLWVTGPKAPPRQITFEDDPDVAVGATVWSPNGGWIAYVSSKGSVGFEFGLWLVRPDGSENHQVVRKGLSPAWSDDGKWLYYAETASTPIKRVAVPGGAPEPVRQELVRNVSGTHGSTIYFVVERALTDGRPVFEICAAPIGSGPMRVLARIPESRAPISWQVANPALSPDGKWLALPLTDGFTTNVWAISTEDGRLKQITDFRGRATFIARRVSWSPDGRSILAAVGEGDADIVVLDGLIRSPGR